MLSPLVFILTLTALSIATVTDIKTREVPDTLNYGLISIGFVSNLLASIVYYKPEYILNSIVGFFFFLILGLIMYYSGQWGGGDAKMVMALGSLIGLNIANFKNEFLIKFLINMVFIGALYGIVISIVLVIKNRKKFKMKNKNKLVSYLIITSALILAIIFFIKEVYMKIMLSVLVVSPLILLYIWKFVKAVEEICMIKYVSPLKLTEGDWIVKDIIIDGKVVYKRNNKGIEKKDIEKLIRLYKQKKLHKVMIKEGIPFIPSFLLSFIFTYLFGNMIFLLLR